MERHLSPSRHRSTTLGRWLRRACLILTVALAGFVWLAAPARLSAATPTDQPETRAFPDEAVRPKKLEDNAVGNCALDASTAFAGALRRDVVMRGSTRETLEAMAAEYAERWETGPHDRQTAFERIWVNYVLARIAAFDGDAALAADYSAKALDVAKRASTSLGPDANIEMMVGFVLTDSASQSLDLNPNNINRAALEQALVHYDRAIEISSHTAFAWIGAGFAHFLLGQADLEASNFDDAGRHLEEATAQISHASILCGMSGPINLMLGQIDILQAFIAYYCDCPDIAAQRMDVALGRLATSVAQTPVATEYDQWIASWLVELAETASSYGKHDHARRYLEAAIVHASRSAEFAPTDVEVHNIWGLAGYRLALLSLEELNRADATKLLREAIAHFSRAVALDANYATPHDNWAYALDELGKIALKEERPIDAATYFTCATEHYAQSTEIDPSDPEIWRSWSETLYRLAALAEAEGDTERAARLRREAVEKAKRARELSEEDIAMR